MKFNSYIVLTYGILVMLGGLIGYLTAESVASLIAGSLFGALIIGGALGMLRESAIAYFLSIALSAVLTAFFTHRYFLTEKWVPAGAMASLSLLVLILLLTTKKRV